MSASGDATTAVVPLKKRQTELRDLLEKRKAHLVSVLPRHISPDAFMRKVIFACMKNPEIAECDAVSVVQSVTEAAQLGLDPSGLLGEGYILPFKDRRSGKKLAQFIPGYRGLLALARRSGNIVSIEAHAVFEGDRFECVLGLDPSLRHEPDWDGDNLDDPRALRFVYAVAKLKDGGQQFEVMSRKAVERIRSRSKSGGSDYSPWATDYVAMALKTVIRRIFKYLPTSTELARALAAEDVVEAQDITAGDVSADAVYTEIEAPTKVSQLKARVAEKVAVSAPPPVEESDDERIAREMREEAEAAGR